MMERCRTVAYLRVASAEHDLEKTKTDIMVLANEKGLGEVEWIEEIVSGFVSWKKRKIAQILQELQAGDNVIVRDLSRFGRSEKQCVEILSSASEKGIRVYTVDPPWLLDGSIPSHLLSSGFQRLQSYKVGSPQEMRVLGHNYQNPHDKPQHSLTCCF